jgi:c-di-GMP-binding flagellar brake protein YcgR
MKTASSAPPFAPGQLVALEAAVHGEPVALAGRLTGVESDRLTVTPLPGTEPFLLAPGDLVQARVETPDGVYRFEAEVQALRGTALVLPRPARASRLQRRAHRRGPVRLPVTLHLEGALPLTGTTVDLSAGGTRLRPDRPLDRPSPPGTVGDLLLTLPGREPPIACKCRLVRGGPDELSVQHLALSDLDRTRLDLLVAASTRSG